MKRSIEGGSAIANSRYSLALVFTLCTTAVDAEYLLADGTVVRALDTFTECGSCPEMVVIPQGSFLMGGPIGESRIEAVRNGELVTVDQGQDELPLHTVEIEMPFAMGRTEVTYDQWMVCVAEGACNGYVPPHEVLGNRQFFGDDNRIAVQGSHPVIFVSYLDAIAYTEWLNSQVGADVYRLPTEAEWEYAARAGTQSRFPFGEHILPGQANIDFPDNQAPSPLVPIPVEAMPDAENQWGLRHIAGNVVELTMSCYAERYDGWSTTSRYLSEVQEVTCARTTRGGGYNAVEDYARPAQRGFANENTRSSFLGFRVLRELR